MGKSWWEQGYRYWRSIALVGGILLAATGLWLILPQDSPQEIEIIPAETEKEETEVIVDIAGAIRKPGVYSLPAGSRIQDLLIACGGLSQTADREWVAKNLNRAAPLTDGVKIYIPHQQEERGKIAGSHTQAGNLVNINQAEAALLESLPGIGPSMAQRIIEYRQSQGGFKSLEELMAVPGIGPKTFHRLKDQITLF